MAGHLTRITPQCVRCHVGYYSVILGPRGGVRQVTRCIACDYLHPKPASGYIPLKAPRKRASNAKTSTTAAKSRAA